VINGLDACTPTEPAATISGSAATPYTRSILPEMDVAIAHLRGVLGDESYESLAQ
jgi:hypothetical protein